MPDPKQCRDNADFCANLAENAKTPEERESFMELAQTWIQLAINMETLIGLMDECDDSRRGVHESHAFESKQSSK